MSTMASIKFELGHQAEAVELAKTVYSTILITHGEKHPDTLMALGDLAALYTRLGDYEEAEPLVTRASELRATCLGPLHPETIQAKMNLALILAGQSRFEEALSLYRQLLPEAEKALGPTHADTRTLRASYASALIKSSDPRTGIQVWRGASGNPGENPEPAHLDTASLLTLDVPRREILEARKATLGSTHPLTLEAIHDLANAYIFQKRFAKAEKLTQDEITVRRQQDQPPTREFLKLLQRLGMLKANQDSFESAKDTLLEVHSGMVSLLGNEHPDTVTAKKLLDEMTRRIESRVNNQSS
jgi:tetratricopeptide (TPR) repeat protein